MDQLTAQNPSSIQSMFGAISKKYDLANSVLSLGIHHLWKRTLIKQSGIRPGSRVLDCATGTGDLAFLFESAAQNQGEFVGSDFCEPMLEVAKQKAAQMGSHVQFEMADVMNLPYADDTFDIASISFGIRNVKDTQKGLSELGRVVKPGGRVLVLEFGQPRFHPMRVLFNFYSHWVLPKVGGWISGQPKAYQYLQSSSAQFPCAEDFLAIAQATGKFKKLSYTSFQTGIAYLYLLER